MDVSVRIPAIAWEDLADDTVRPAAAGRSAQAACASAGSFSQLYALHSRYVAGVVYRLLGDDADLDDIVQEAFVDAAEGLHRLVEPAAARSWLVTIAVRRVQRALRRRRRWRLLFGQVERLAPRVSDPRDRQCVDELYDALDHLPADLRIPWILSRVEQVTLPQVARCCEVSLATVKRRIAEAEARIQRRIGP